jgi:hypothetical protein
MEIKPAIFKDTWYVTRIARCIFVTLCAGTSGLTTSRTGALAVSFGGATVYLPGTRLSWTIQRILR